MTLAATGVVAKYSPLTAGLEFRLHAGKVPKTPFDAPPGSWTFVFLPDTQYYSQYHAEVFVRQTEWIAAHKDIHQIRFVSHSGDFVNNPRDTQQWQKARKAMKVLVDGAVPFSVLPGNHDLGTQEVGLTNGRETLLNSYFSESDYRHSEAFGLFEAGKMENSWHEFNTPTGKRLVLALEFGPRDEVLAWANKVVAQRPDHKVIVTTHSYLYADSRRSELAYDLQHQGRANPRTYPLASRGNVNDGQDMWEKFVSRHQQIEFVFNGHICEGGTGHLASTGIRGNTVHQILANYQDNSPDPGGTVSPARGYGGGGFMRLVQFYPDGKSVRIRSYSPWYDEWLTEANQEFALTV